MADNVIVRVPEQQFIRGEDGYSPEVTIENIDHGHSVTIRDRDHPEGQSFNVLDGASAYEQAVAGGYTGTEAQFNEELASFKELSEQAANSAQQAASGASTAQHYMNSAWNAVNSANLAKASAESAAAQALIRMNSAGTSAQEASASATAASQAEGNAANSATAAAGSATAAAGSASTASTAATTAQGHATNAASSATAASGSATSAASSATAAGNAQTAAETAQAAAEDAQEAAEAVLASIPEDYTELSDDVDNLKSAVSAETRNLVFDKISNVNLNTNGSIKIDNAYDLWLAPVVAGGNYAITSDEPPYQIYAFFTEKPSVGSVAYGNQRYVNNTPYVTAPVTGYITVRSRIDFDGVQVENGYHATPYIPHITATDFVAREELANISQNTINLIDPADTIKGFIANSSGTITVSDVYLTSGYIPVKEGQKVTISPNCRKFLAYSADKSALTESYLNNGSTSSYTYTATADGFVRASYVATNLEQIEYGENASDYVPFGKELSNNILLNTEQISQIEQTSSNVSSALYGKKIVFCGDSFTAGDFTGLQQSDYLFQNGKYAGLKMVYPYFIGLKTGANIVNEAIGGSTMAYINGERNEFSTPNGRYTQIPTDADYIVLYFGINDSHQQVPIGSISDNVNTTFYGAWNIVMQYLFENHPDAKIGIIVSNGCDRIDYPNAEIAIAKKYGVSYLDINGDYNIPIIFRVNGKPDVDPDILSANRRYYAVKPSGDPTNFHPNVKMHKYESTIFQHWLESI